MNRHKVQYQWRDLDALASVVRETGNLGDNFASFYTSLDRIVALQELTHRVKEALRQYVATDEAERDCIRRELLELRSHWMGLVNECEGEIQELEQLGSNLDVVSIPDELENPASDEASSEFDSDQDQVSQSFDLDRFDDPVIENLVETSSDNLKFDNGADGDFRLSLRAIEKHAIRKRNGATDLGASGRGEKRSRRQLTRAEALEFKSLLFQLKELGFRVDDAYGKEVGKAFVSLTSRPDEEARPILLRLLALGLEIWPGRHFLEQ